MELIKTQDPAVYEAMQAEKERQESNIELIASENFVSQAVMDAQGSVLTNKYAEGYPGKRYYGGCEYVDIAEQLAIDRAKQLFGADYANVQPHSGSQANTSRFAFEATGSQAARQSSSAAVGRPICGPSRIRARRGCRYSSGTAASTGGRWHRHATHPGCTAGAGG